MSDKTATETTTTTEANTEDKGEKPPADEMTAEEKKFLMQTLWESLIAPKWTKDPLINFGKAIFSKKLLKDLSDKEFNEIFPFLRDATLELGKRLMQRKAENDKVETETKTSETANDAETEK